MKIDNATENFFRLIKSNDSLDLNDYHKEHPDIFNTYFNGYCKKTDVKMAKSIERYSEDYSRLEKVIKMLPHVIEKVAAKGERHFGFSINVPVHIFVGIYGSNAFVDHQAEIYLAVEKLPSDPGLLEIIVAHEMVHSYHYHLLGNAGIDWNSIDWLDARNSMYLEGVATSISEKLVPGYSKSVYFSYDEQGEEWLSFCHDNHLRLADAFLIDFKNGSVNMEREWFRLSGGQQFGYSRIGYYLGTVFVTDLCRKLSEREILTLLAKGSVSKAVDCWFGAQEGTG